MIHNSTYCIKIKIGLHKCKIPPTLISPYKQSFRSLGPPHGLEEAPVVH